MLASVTDWIYTYVLILALLAVGVRFSGVLRLFSYVSFARCFVGWRVVFWDPTRTIQLSGACSQRCWSGWWG